ncbi:copper resistance system multicopper oxidase [Sphingomonas gei]|uniref:Copper resistance system multicopper oxidase n=1 Tax=Sphingomonas gei TaxID=1395960 RepID=A0A4S1XJ11_9SPHN|nr:copper resistance system multicopper oxidase [Sphingomonas gei]TGX56221.1 copper resistance system multicopper oxidase [Sphingomonas gei]
MNAMIDRRGLLRGAALAGGTAAFARWMPAWAQRVSPGLASTLPTLAGEDITLRVAHQRMTVDGRHSHAIGINGTVPAPLIRLREGQQARLHVVNDLDEETSVHWHGLILPFQMDGVPGISFPGIPARSTFTYEFPIVQSGTYWYHSHSGLQEQMGHYGPIVIDPADDDPVAYDREHVIVLSDHSPLHPHQIFLKLKKQAGYFNRRRQTLGGLLQGEDQPLKQRLQWGGMRMDPTDIADVTGSTYTYLVNGHGPGDNWTALFQRGERVRLRIINASAMTIFNLRIPGLTMQVVQADGQNVRPVDVDELQITIAETYDVIVTPHDARAYSLIAESVDRSGMARATLAPRPGMAAEVPPLRKRPIATMKDMGMDMSGMDHGDMGAGVGMNMAMRDPANAPQVRMGPGVQTIAPMVTDRTGEPGQGLEDAGHRVLTYRDLVASERNPDVRGPARELQIHLTGNMERYMWSLDGEKLSEVKDPIPFIAGERVRVTLINDTMMSHPIHLHGHFFELVTGHGDHSPRKHTVNVLPGSKVSWDVTAVPGDWAFHCHMLYHMHAGMMQVVRVRPLDGAAA